MRRRRGPDTVVHVVVDYEALVRGHTVAGETCEIPGVGPIPVSVAQYMSQDAILKVLITKGVDVVTVAHAGYTIPAHLRSALDVRDRKCIVPGCDAYRRLQKDHRSTFGRTGVTKLEDLAHLCPWHHYLETFLGYTYRGGPGTWEWSQLSPYCLSPRTLGPVAWRTSGIDPCHALGTDG